MMPPPIGWKNSAQWRNIQDVIAGFNDAAPNRAEELGYFLRMRYAVAGFNDAAPNRAEEPPNSRRMKERRNELQ